MYYPTGNDYISIPTLTEGGSIESVNFLHMGYRGLIEVCGDPLVKPYITIDGIEAEISDVTWRRDCYWIPVYTGNADTLDIKATICTPQGFRGFIYMLDVKNNGKDAKVDIGFKGRWTDAKHSINESKFIDGKRHVYESRWNNGPMFDFKNGITIFSFGFVTDGKFDNIKWDEDSYSASKSYILHRGETASLTLYFAIGLDEVSAAASAIDMMRHGGTQLIGYTEDWLKDRIKSYEDRYMEEVLNLNMFFNYFYSTGIALDTEEIVAVTSRSPRYYVSAAYWDRDSLLWSFPAVLMTDIKRAGEVLNYVFTKQMRNIGIHSRFIDGTVLEPGFELDEACAPVIAVKAYVDFTNDYSILDREKIKDGLNRVVALIESKKHSKIDLYETFLQPTDDMIVYPYLTYNNVLVWRVFDIMAEFARYWGEDGEPYRAAAERIRDAIMCKCVTEMDGRDMFTWAVDLNGNYQIYDEPPGSLTMLAYYGFVNEGDEVYKNTLDYLYSESFSHYFGGFVFRELGCSHANHPWVLSVADSLLNGRKNEALEMIRRMPMDNKIACESIDENTGECVTGGHFATCAGFLSYAMYTALCRE